MVGLKSRINRYLLTVIPSLIVAVQPCIEWIPVKEKGARTVIDMLTSESLVNENDEKFIFKPF